MVCIVAGIRSGGFGLSVLGGFAGGLGGIANFAGPLSSVMSGLPAVTAMASSIGAVAGAAGPFASIAAQVAAGANPLTQLTSAVGAGGFLNSIGSAVNLGSGSITGMLGAGFESIGGLSFADGLANHAGELFGSGPLQAMQSLAGAEAFSAISMDIAGPVANALTGQFGGAISSLTQALPIDGNFGNFLGSAIPDMNAMVTNGLTNFMPNLSIPGFAGDMINLGSAFDMGDMLNFGNPGQLVGKLLEQGAGGITGLDSVLNDLKFDPSIIANLGSGQFNDVLSGALSQITNPEMIANAQQMLGSAIPNMESLNDFMDLSKIMPTSFASMIPDTMEQFKEQLQGIDIGSITLPTQFGGLVNNLKAVDFDVIKNFTDVIDPDAAISIAANFLGGTGMNNSVSVSDIMGSVGGIGIKDNTAIYSKAMNEMDDLGVFDSFKTINAQLQAGIAGTFTSGSKVYDTDVITDPAGIIHETLDSFVAAKKGQLEAAVADIASGASGASAEVWSGAFGKAKSSFTSMQNKILSEDVHAAKTDLHLEFRNESPDNAYQFIAGLTQKVADSANLALIQGMNEAEVSTNKFKEYMKGAIAEAQNINEYDKFGILPRASKIQEV
jgi:hypothetical protein